MQHCLDTRTCVEMMRRGEAFNAIDLELSACMISSVTLFELEYGIRKAPRPLKKKLEERMDLLLGNITSEAFGGPASREAATIRFELEKRGTPIGHFDTLIAGHARSRGLTLVTGNAREFKRVPKLKVLSI
jgi:tRNA(fMet)-specific endonuclease VapC